MAGSGKPPCQRQHSTLIGSSVFLRPLDVASGLPFDEEQALLSSMGSLRASTGWTRVAPVLAGSAAIPDGVWVGCREVELDRLSRRLAIRWLEAPLPPRSPATRRIAAMRPPPPPPSVGLALTRLVGLLMRDVALTHDEVVGLKGGLLASEAAPIGTTRLNDWRLAKETKWNSSPPYH